MSFANTFYTDAQKNYKQYYTTCDELPASTKFSTHFDSWVD